MSNISAKVIAHSIETRHDTEIVSFELEFPKFILAEFNTHRMFSRNTASSRAIPIDAMLKLVKDNPAVPVFWGKAKAGMSADEEITNPDDTLSIWHTAKDRMLDLVKVFNHLGLHKQTANRILEPFQMVRTVVTATELENFFWLRVHPAAQPEMKELATKMYEAREVSKPTVLNPGDWHLPYFEDGYWNSNSIMSLEDARKISISCCAQVSYRNQDFSLEKANSIIRKLTAELPYHLSPFEHQANPMQQSDPLFKTGVTHLSNKDGSWWSANFKNWIQYRQLINDQNLTERFTCEEKHS